jgi:hypothetical protein
MPKTLFDGHEMDESESSSYGRTPKPINGKTFAPVRLSATDSNAGDAYRKVLELFHVMAGLVRTK